MEQKRKIINDPVHGFITISHPLIFAILEHPYYQRLRLIHQMALAYLVYPGAVHTRLHHSLGAYHLMCEALDELRAKGVEITAEEDVAVKAAIFLHDIGHGPFSHALEHSLLPDTPHEVLSLRIMEKMNEEMNGALTLAIQIFKNQYPKTFLHQLISGQLDMDRMDYLSRDSFFSGVIEGTIGSDRILKMLVVKDNELMIEEKGIYSVEKFLVARRLMYWQVYLHKAVLSSEKMLIKTLDRAREIYNFDDEKIRIHSALDHFIDGFKHEPFSLDLFCSIDDTDVVFAIKKWSNHPDIILSTLAKGFLHRRLFKCVLQSTPVSEEIVSKKRTEIAKKLGISETEAAYVVFTGEAVNTTYKMGNEDINILFKNGEVKNISQVDNPLIHKTVSTTIKKYYFCFLA